MDSATSVGEKKLRQWLSKCLGILIDPLIVMSPLVLPWNAMQGV